MGQTVGILIGAVIAAVVVGNFAAGYWLCAAALLAGVVLYLFKNDDQQLPPTERPPFNLADFLKGFWVSPKRYPDFAWAWLTRLLVSTGNHMVTLYLLFFLSDAVRSRKPKESIRRSASSFLPGFTRSQSSSPACSGAG